MAADSSAIPQRSWRASLELDFAAVCGRTVVARRQHAGPLCIQKPFYPGDGSCHVYVLHPPGGLAGGDDVSLAITAESGTATLLTMPASTKFYRSDGHISRLHTHIDVAPGAALEWLPTESILFGGSRAVMDTQIRLRRGSTLIGWETIALGRPLSGDHYASGDFAQRLEICVDDQPLLVERLAAAAGDAVLGADWGLAGHGVSATWLAYPCDPALLDRARAVLDEHPQILSGASLVDGLLVVRALGQQVEPVRNLLEAVRAAVAPILLGRPVQAPRIWKT